MAKPAALSEYVSDEQLDAVLEKVEYNSVQVDYIVEKIVNDYCKEVDDIMWQLRDILNKIADKNEVVSDSYLETFILQIPARLYFATTASEYLGVRDDIAHLVYKEAYNAARQGVGGTVADKNAQAEQQTNPQALTAVVYNRASRMVKARLEAAFEMLTALKKVVSARIAERGLAQSDTTNGR